MRGIRLMAVVLFGTVSVSGQTSLEGIGLEQGRYGVGYRHYTLIDSTRQYGIENDFNNQLVHRPIPVSMWYPAKTEGTASEPLAVLNYLEVLKQEEEWEDLPNGFLLDWFPYLWNTPQNKAHLPEKVMAVPNPDFAHGRFPVVVYAPSYQASSIENFVLFEYLASHGYVVLSSPSRGTRTRLLEGGTTKDMETQARDVEFLLKEVQGYRGLDPDKLALMGFSFGGMANILTAVKHKGIRAIVSLDGTERYNYPVLEGSPYFDLDRFTVPYIHFAQKEIPKEVMVQDKIPEGLNHGFQLYDSILNADVHSYRFHDLTHSYFSSFGVLFANRDKRQDKSDDKIMASYNLLCGHSLRFLDATLKGDQRAKAFIRNRPEQNGFSEALISKKMKKAQRSGFDHRDFNDLALKQEFQDLIPLYKKTITEHPGLQLSEGMLNTLGLRLSFNAQKFDHGINVFLLALHLYPDSANLYDSLAEAYLHHGDLDNAMANFKKSLELDPGNQNAIDRLGQLRK